VTTAGTLANALSQQIFFIRVRDWWFYKMPPPIMLLTMLAGHVPAIDLLLALASLVVVIALACNLGYALNELFDVEEDTKKGKPNVTAHTGPRNLWFIAGMSAAGSLLAGFTCIGGAAVILTLCSQLLSLAYSAPPLRLKERKWLGVLADAMGAHVYPAMLCLLIAARWAPDGPGELFTGTVLLWSLAFGLRGILSHLTLDDELDRAAGLTTVVHDHGRESTVNLLLRFIAPLEIGCFILVVLQVSPGMIFYAVICIYLLFEALKVYWRWKSIIFTRDTLSNYIPFLNNSFYEVWGPLGAASAAAANDWNMLLLPPILVLLFWSRICVEWKMIDVLSRGIARACIQFIGGTLAYIVARMAQVRRGLRRLQ
jgi:4-hydroxybenzoate polyprenyltransferase